MSAFCLRGWNRSAKPIFTAVNEPIASSAPSVTPIARGVVAEHSSNTDENALDNKIALYCLSTRRASKSFLGSVEPGMKYTDFKNAVNEFIKT